MSNRQSLWAALVMTTLSACWLFGDGLCEHQVPAFRDGFHFYYPQAVWLDNQFQTGHYFPTWNAQESFGTAVSGQPSAALFYPLRPLWWIPGPSIEQRYALFLIVHLVIAAWGMQRCAIRWGKDGSTASWIGVAYALSGPVLFQHSNLIYLCSAAWLGWMLSALAGWVRTGHATLKDQFQLGLFVSLMALGGDFHAAVNCLLILLAVALRHALWAFRQPGKTWPRCAGGTLPLRQFLLVLVLCATFTAPQWTSTVAWLQTSHSRQYHHADARQGASEDDGVTAASQLAAQLIAEVPPLENNVFDFSLAPWHLLTLVWPTVGGHFLPEHGRWWSLFHVEPRMWIPSLYCGFLPILLLLSRWCRRRDSGQRGDPFFGWLAAAALLLALGNFTVLWALRNVLHWLGLEEITARLPPDRVAGPYYWLTQLVPGYAWFRYPAKWTTFFAAAMLGAIPDLSRRSPVARTPNDWRNLFSRRLQLCVCCGSITWLGLAIILFRFFPSYLPGDGMGADPWFGPVIPGAAAKQILTAALLPLAILTAWALVRYAARWRRGQWDKGIVLTVITWLEMTLIGGTWVILTPAPRTEPIRIAVDNVPHARVWSDISGANFLRDCPDSVNGSFVEQQVAYQVEFLLGKLGLVRQVDSIAATQSLPAHPVERLQHRLMGLDTMEPDQPELDSILGQLGVSWRLVRTPRADDRGRLTWKPIPDPRPLCELIYPGADPHTPPPPLVDRWHWQSPHRLAVELPPIDQAAILLVRLYNWKGCQAYAMASDRHEATAPLEIRDHAFFVEVTVPPGTRMVHVCFP
ncbi:MAG: hypothetical protein KatS3mg111_0821 [Pirellulaceae bacterium]|nr:MAG: hypothetical protein KatS3mg111_0821 [Pirellulaceae bacterium]